MSFVLEYANLLAHPSGVDSAALSHADCKTAWTTMRRLREFQVYEKSIFETIFAAIYACQPDVGPDQIGLLNASFTRSRLEDKQQTGWRPPSRLRRGGREFK